MTQAAWIPQAHCHDLPSFDASVAAPTERGDKLLERKPWLVAVVYSLNLPIQKVGDKGVASCGCTWA